MKRPHEGLAPHEIMYYREKLNRLRTFKQPDDFGLIAVQNVMLGALCLTAVLAVGTALVQ